MRGIVATGCYLPRLRLSGDAVEAAWGTSAPVSTAAVPNADEDAVTMAVAAGRDALRGSGGDDAGSDGADGGEAEIDGGEAEVDGDDPRADDTDDRDPADVAHLAIATTTPPLDEEALAPRIAAALGLGEDVTTVTFTQHTGVAADALRSAFEASGRALALVADAPGGDPGDVGQRVGAGAAAFLVDAEGAVVPVDAATRSRDAPGIRYRERGERDVASLDVTTYERETTRDLVVDAVGALSVEAFEAAALHQPTPDLPGRIARGLPLDGDAVARGTVVDDVGDAGAATPALGLLAAIEGVAEGGTVLLGTFGSGATATALAVEVQRPLSTDLDAALAGGRSLSYPEALRERGHLGRVDVAGGGAHVSLPSWQRTLPGRYRLIGGRCPACGALAFPAEGACPDCHERVVFDPVELPRTGTVVAVTVVGQGGAPPEFAEQQRRDGPFAVAVVELERGDETVRLPAQLTDCEPDAVAAGDAVRAAFRRIYETEGVRRYGSKFVPRE